MESGWSSDLVPAGKENKASGSLGDGCPEHRQLVVELLRDQERYCLLLVQNVSCCDSDESQVLDADGCGGRWRAGRGSTVEEVSSCIFNPIW